MKILPAFYSKSIILFSPVWINFGKTQNFGKSSQTFYSIWPFRDLNTKIYQDWNGSILQQPKIKWVINLNSAFNAWCPLKGYAFLNIE